MSSEKPLDPSPPIEPYPTAEQLREYEPRLRLWTRYAAQAFALFRGANLALGVEPFEATEARDLAHKFRAEATLMLVLRLSALLDRDPKSLSFQAVNRGLKSPETCEEVVRLYLKDEPAHLAALQEAECRRFQTEFKNSYAKINWKAHGRLQSFRNTNIAHIAPEETSKTITYGELEQFSRVIFELQFWFSLLTHGLHTDTKDDVDLWSEDYKKTWLGAFAASGS